MSLLLALAAATIFGSADFLGGLSARRMGALWATLVAQVAGFAIVLPALLLQRAPPSAEAIGWGVLAGIGGGIGLAVFFRALASGMMAVAAPVTAVVAAGLPVAAGVAFGERPSPAAWAGIGAGLLGILLLGWSGRSRWKDARGGLLMALAAGGAWGLFFIALARSPHGHGFWPLLGTRISSSLLLVGLLAVVRPPLPARLELSMGTRLAVLSGGLDMTANGLFLLAVQQGKLALVAVLVALYPAVTVLLSFAVLGERLRPWQLAGAGLALLAIALIAST